MQLTVGISEMRVSRSAEDTLVTYSLGSCIGVALFDPDAGVGGLIHCMLPLSRLDPDKAKQNPHMFTDTGIPSLIQAVLDRGGTRKRLVAKVAGAASPLNDNGMFKIGERNYTVLRKVLWKNEILIAAEDVGGTIARTMVLTIANGRTTIRTGGKEREL
ncbi:MAG: chemotaxis protein CheD [Candidatus Hydrogenedentes bacterium]|nr:chemotaxis protein CheD [Candidatus Hydrogenedentota bacterium]